jgi:selenocysteine lyase/cysteine desulfurase
MEPSLIESLRKSTPGTLDRIHLNNAGAALMPEPVIQAIQKHIELESRMGGYEAAAFRQTAIHCFYAETARLIRARPDQIAFTTNATEAFNRAVNSIPFRAGDCILTTLDDYVSNQLAFMQLRERFGVRILHARNLPKGGVDLDHFAELLAKEQPRLVAVTHVPTSSGLVQPLEKISEICRTSDAWYLVDACQSAGQLPLDVEKIGCDFLSSAFRKWLRGPRGTGFLYVSDRVIEEGLEPLFLDLSSATWTAPDQYEALTHARRFETWERSYACLLGAAEAAVVANDLGIAAIADRIRHLTSRFRTELSNMDRIQVLDRGDQLCGIVTLHIEGATPRMIKKQLLSHGINHSFGMLTSARFDLSAKQVEWVLRLSPHYYNTEEELETTTAVLREFTGRL